MEFPIWQAPFLGPGMTIGLDAVLHVFVSHGVALGAFGMVIFSDWLVLRRPDVVHGPTWDRYNRRLLKFTVITASTVGAVTGAGIWMTTGSIAPNGIGSMLRVFFWPWYIEWIVFVIEVVILLAYWFNWDRMAAARRTRVRLGLAYLAVVSVSAILITGILAFMLTPGDWPTGRRFAQAFFTPSYPPQLIFRLSFAFMIGAILALAFAAFGPADPAFRRGALRRFGLLLAATLPPFAVSLYAYFTVIPPAYIQRLEFSVLTSNLSQWTGTFVAINVLAGLGVLALTAAAFLRRPRLTRWLVFPALVLVLGFVTEFERVREFIRGPFVMPGYMWVGGVLLQETPIMRRTGMLAESGWYLDALPQGPDRTLHLGAQLFARNCSGCHTVDGLNDIRAKVRGRSEDGLYVLTDYTHEMVSFMPPFSGTDDERRAVAHFLYRLWHDELPMASYSRYVPGEVQVAR